MKKKHVLIACTPSSQAIWDWQGDLENLNAVRIEFTNLILARL
jgi:hypothetical protein